MSVVSSSSMRPFWMRRPYRRALRVAVAATAFGLVAANASAQAGPESAAPQAMPAEDAAPAHSGRRAGEPHPPIQPADTPIVESISAPAQIPEPTPPPPTPGDDDGPALIPDGEAPPGPVAPAFPPVIPNIDYAARMRFGLRMQDPSDPKKLGDLGGELSADMYFVGQIHRLVKWQIGVTGSYTGAPGSPSSAEASLLDVTARFEFMPELNVYAGRMIVVADRYTPSGPWGMDEWFYPGVFPGVALPALMRSGPVGRDVGVNVWGGLLGGHVKYYLGAYQFHDPTLSPLFSGRVQVSLLTPEPGFFQRTTYYGYRDLVAFGVGAQYQNDGSVQRVAAPADGSMAPAPMIDDYNYVTADVVVDKKLGDSGTISFNGSLAKFGGDYQLWTTHYLASVGYLLPGVVGVGKLRPSLRFQGAQAKGAENASMIIDAQIGYVIMPWFARVALGYRFSSVDVGTGSVKGNMIFLGITLADP